MQIHSVGIDLGKTTFQLAALSEAGKVLVSTLSVDTISKWTDASRFVP